MWRGAWSGHWCWRLRFGWLGLVASTPRIVSTPGVVGHVGRVGRIRGTRVWRRARWKGLRRHWPHGAPLATAATTRRRHWSRAWNHGGQWHKRRHHWWYHRYMRWVWHDGLWLHPRRLVAGAPGVIRRRWVGGRRSWRRNDRAAAAPGVIRRWRRCRRGRGPWFIVAESTEIFLCLCVNVRIG